MNVLLFINHSVWYENDAILRKKPVTPAEKAGKNVRRPYIPAAPGSAVVKMSVAPP
jgi:hypothetical protein